MASDETGNLTAQVFFFVWVCNTSGIRWESTVDYSPRPASVEDRVYLNSEPLSREFI